MFANAMSDNDLPDTEHTDNTEIDVAAAMTGVTRIRNDRADLRGQPKKLKLANDETTRYKRQMADQDE